MMKGQEAVGAAAVGTRLPVLSEGLRLRGLRCRLVRKEDVPRLLALEQECFPPAEAASEETLRRRVGHAQNFFLVVVRSEAAGDGEGEIVGFVNGTLKHGESMESECWTQHEQRGTTLGVHKVCVAESMRRQGVASAMLQQYIRMVENWRPQVQRMILIAKAHLVGFYTSCGFTIKGLSDIVHGADRWFEFERRLLETRVTPLYHVDAFTDQIFAGNPAAVLVLDGRELAGEGAETPDTWMQQVGADMNLAETAFVCKLRPNETLPADDDGDRDDDDDDGSGDCSPRHVAHYSIRWFTPHTEEELCGHATLASAHVLFFDAKEREDPKTTELRFYTNFGAELRVRHVASSGRLEMDFPALSSAPLVLSAEQRACLVRGIFGSEEADTDANDARILNIVRAPLDILVEVTPDVMDMLRPEPRVFAELPISEERGVVVTCAGCSARAEYWDAVRDQEPTTLDHPLGSDVRRGSRWAGHFDIVSRFLQRPPASAPEDPVTGSAHCELGPYWADRLGTSSLHCFQASLRGGVLDVELYDNRVLLRGSAITVYSGTVASPL